MLRTTAALLRRRGGLPALSLAVSAVPQAAFSSSRRSVFSDNEFAAQDAPRSGADYLRSHPPNAHNNNSGNSSGGGAFADIGDGIPVGASSRRPTRNSGSFTPRSSNSYNNSSYGNDDGLRNDPRAREAAAYLSPNGGGSGSGSGAGGAPRDSYDRDSRGPRDRDSQHRDRDRGRDSRGFNANRSNSSGGYGANRGGNGGGFRGGNDSRGPSRYISDREQRPSDREPWQPGKDAEGNWLKRRMDGVPAAALPGYRQSRLDAAESNHNNSNSNADVADAAEGALDAGSDELPSIRAPGGTPPRFLRLSAVAPDVHRSNKAAAASNSNNKPGALSPAAKAKAEAEALAFSKLPPFLQHADFRIAGQAVYGSHAVLSALVHGRRREYGKLFMLYSLLERVEAELGDEQRLQADRLSALRAAADTEAGGKSLNGLGDAVAEAESGAHMVDADGEGAAHGLSSLMNDDGKASSFSAKSADSGVGVADSGNARDPNDNDLASLDEHAAPAHDDSAHDSAHSSKSTDSVSSALPALSSAAVASLASLTRSATPRAPSALEAARSAYLFAQERGIPVLPCNRAVLDHLSNSRPHNGLVLDCARLDPQARAARVTALSPAQLGVDVAAALWQQGTPAAVTEDSLRAQAADAAAAAQVRRSATTAAAVAEAAAGDEAAIAAIVKAAAEAPVPEGVWYDESLDCGMRNVWVVADGVQVRRHFTQ